MLVPAQIDALGGIDWIAVLNTGATGFAVIMLYISYQLIARAQSLVFQKDPTSFPDLDTFRAWSRVVESQVRQTRWFMVLAGLFFFGGIGVVVYQYQAESNIVLKIQPYDQPFPRVFVQGEEEHFKESGHVPLTVQSGRTVEVYAKTTYDRMRELESEVVKLTSKIEGFEQALRATSTRGERASGESGL